MKTVQKIVSATVASARALGPNIRFAVEEGRGRTIVSYAYFVAYIYVIGTVLFTGAQLMSDFTSKAVQISLPVQEFWPGLPAGAKITGGPTAHVVSGGFTDATVSVSGLNVAARSWLAASSLLQGATILVLAIVVVTLCSTILRNQPFQPAVTRGIRTAGFAVMLGGIGWQTCSANAGLSTSQQVLQLESAEFKNRIDFTDITTIIGFPSPSSAFHIDLWPIWVGLAFFALAAAFRYGEHLQRDTEGLV